jgi:hypothetical protein
LLSRVGSSGSYLTEVLPAVVVLGLGLAATVAPLTSTALSSAPAQHAGMASAVNNDVARAAALIAVAVLPAVVGISGSAYLHPETFSSGFHKAVLVSGALCVLSGLMAAVTIRDPARPEQEEDGPEAAQRSCGLEAPPNRSS